MPEHDLLLQINQTVGTILTKIGSIDSGIQTSNDRIDWVEKQLSSVCGRTDIIEDYVKAQKTGYRTAIILTGIASGLIGAVGGIIMFIITLIQFGNMMKGGGSP